MSVFPLKEEIGSKNGYFQNEKSLGRSSSNANSKKVILENEGESKKMDITEKKSSKPRSISALSCENNIDFIDIQLAKDFKEERRHIFLEQKRRQQLRENTQELKELEMKLRNAYISKGLAAQIAERELTAAKEKESKYHENELLELARISYGENERKKEELEKQKKEKLRTELKKQMELHKCKRALKMEEYMEEKRAVEQISRKISEEQYEEQSAKKENQIKIKLEIEELLKAREILKAANEAVNIKEDQDIEALKKERDERERKKIQEKLFKVKQRETISENIGTKLNIDMKEKIKRINVFEDLLIEEKMAHEDDLERKENFESLKKAAEYKIGLHDMIENNKRRAEEQAEKDRQYMNELLEDLAKKDELVKVKEKEKTKKMLEHKQAVLDGLDYKFQLRTKELTELLKQRENDIRESQRNQECIEMERIKILQEHATALEGFFPPGVLKQADREFLSMPKKGDMK